MEGPDPRRSPKKFFSALRTSVWSKKKWRGGGGSPRVPSMDPPLNDTGWVVREAKQANRVYLRCLLLFPMFFKFSFLFLFILFIFAPFSRFYHIVLIARFKTLLEIVSQIENGTNFPIIGRHSFSFYF